MRRALGTRGADLAQARRVARAAELELQERHGARGCGGLRGHRLGGVEADGVGRGDGVQRGETGELRRRRAGALGLVVPQRAVERVAGGARRHLPRQAGAIAKRAAQAEDGIAHAVNRLAVARVGDALAAPGDVPSLTCATTTVASRLAPRAMTNAPAIGQLSTTASMVRDGMGAQHRLECRHSRRARARWRVRVMCGLRLDARSALRLAGMT